MTDIAAMAEPQAGREPLAAARAFVAQSGRAALATVIETWGSSPVATGGQLAVASDGRFEGSVSGGCVEGEVITEAEDVMASGVPKTLEFGVEDETAWRVGLPCGGRIKVLVEPLDSARSLPLLDRLLAARAARTGLVVSTRLADGAKDVFDEVRAQGHADIAGRFRSARSSLTDTADGPAFLHALMPAPRVLIVGATHIGQILAELVRLAGYQVVVIDPRSAFAAQARFPGVELVAEWPQDAIPRLGLDPFTAVVALAHVGHIDDEALQLALKTECLYVGALGSKRNHAKRTERLLAAGFSSAEIARIASPIGIDIGAQSPPEIAVAVMAQIILALRGPKAARAAKSA